MGRTREAIQAADRKSLTGGRDARSDAGTNSRAPCQGTGRNEALSWPQRQRVFGVKNENGAEWRSAPPVQMFSPQTAQSTEENEWQLQQHHTAARKLPTK